MEAFPITLAKQIRAGLGEIVLCRLLKCSEKSSLFMYYFWYDSIQFWRLGEMILAHL